MKIKSEKTILKVEIIFPLDTHRNDLYKFIDDKYGKMNWTLLDITPNFLEDTSQGIITIIVGANP